MQQQHPLLGSVPLGRRLEDVDQLHQRDVETEDGVHAAVVLVVEEVVVQDSFLVFVVFPRSLQEEHVVDALERRARHLRVVPDDLEVVLEASFPVLVAEAPQVLQPADQLDDL